MKYLLPAKSLAAVLLLVLVLPRPAMAYIGPGGGLSAIGALLAVIAAVVVAIFGFLWYPAKRLMRAWKKPANSDKDGATE